jgi:hypothetical protein
MWPKKQRASISLTPIRIDSDAFDRILWQGNMGDGAPYPTTRSGVDLSRNRAQLLEQWQEKSKSQRQRNSAALPPRSGSM